MKKSLAIIASLISVLLLSGCGTTFAGTLLVLSFGDIILYVAVAFIIALIIAFKGSATKRKQSFWIGFILSLLLTPIAGFIYLLILFSMKSKD